MKLEPKYKRPFTQFVKKQHKPLQAVIEDEVLKVCENPQAGEAKVGDLAGIRVYKFTHKKQEYLIAYAVQENTHPPGIEFYQIGSHENFYDDLKTYLKANGWYT